jgi:hypothetical protein
MHGETSVHLCVQFFIVMYHFEHVKSQDWNIWVTHEELANNFEVYLYSLILIFVSNTS